MNFLIAFEICSTSKYHSMLVRLLSLHTKQSNEFLLIQTYQDLSYMPHPLFKVNYFLNKHH